jgi:hypothetical protein
MKDPKKSKPQQGGSRKLSKKEADEKAARHLRERLSRDTVPEDPARTKSRKRDKPNGR